MKPTRKLIKGLRKAAKLVLTDRYCWSDHASCNCGMLIQALGMGHREIDKAIFSDYNRDFFDGTWRNIGDEWARTKKKPELMCDVTKLPISKVFTLLEEAGVEPKDLGDIEYLRSTGGRHDDPRDVADYFLKKANELEERFNRNKARRKAKEGLPTFTKLSQFEQHDEPQQVVHVRER